MKKLEAVIGPTRLAAVKEALTKAGLQDGLLISDIKGFEPQSRRTQIFRGLECTVDLRHEVKLELVVSDDDVQLVSGVIASAADPENVGTCRLLVYSLDSMVRNRSQATAKQLVAAHR